VNEFFDQLSHFTWKLDYLSVNSRSLRLPLDRSENVPGNFPAESEGRITDQSPPHTPIYSLDQLSDA